SPGMNDGHVGRIFLGRIFNASLEAGRIGNASYLRPSLDGGIRSSAPPAVSLLRLGNRDLLGVVRVQDDRQHARLVFGAGVLRDAVQAAGRLVERVPGL